MKNEEKIKILQDIVRINSVNGNEEEVAKYLQTLLLNYGIQSELIKYSDGRSNLVAEMGQNKGKILALSGHMDVVDPGDASKWTYPPFDAYIEGNNLHGRGSTDMKSGLAALVISMIELKENNVPFNGGIRLLATVGEEVGELGAEQLTQKGYVDDIDALIIGEPMSYNLVYTHMGSINYKVESIGKEAHSSMPQLGINAINHLNDFITCINAEMQKITDAYEDDILGRSVHSVTVIKGGNQVNSIPNYACLEGNIRSIPEFSNDKMIAVLQRIIDELNKKDTYDLKLSIEFNKIPVKANKDSELIQVIQHVFKDELPLIGIAGTTDAAEFTKLKNNFDFVIVGPGVTNSAHKINEYVEIDNYLDMIDKYKEIIIEYLK